MRQGVVVKREGAHILCYNADKDDYFTLSKRALRLLHIVPELFIGSEVRVSETSLQVNNDLAETNKPVDIHG